jgi:hypothetical protein
LIALLLSLPILLQSSFGPHVASAQDFPLPVSVLSNLQPELQASARAEAQQFANSLYQVLLLKLDEIERVCDPADGQMAKLKVAAKGAVDHALDDWLSLNADRLRAGNAEIVAVQANAQRMNLQQLIAQQAQLEALKRQAQLVQIAIAGKAAEKAASPDAEQAKLNEREALVRQQKALLEQQQVLGQEIAQLEQNVAVIQAVRVQGVAVDNPFGERVLGNIALNTATTNSVSDPAAIADKEEIWSTAIGLTLTVEQKTRLMDAASERSAFKPTTVVDIVLTEIDGRLLLDRAQRDKLIPLVEQVVKQQSLEGQLSRSSNLAPAIASNVLRALPEDQLKLILSEPQQAQRRRMVAPPTATNVNQIPGMFGGEMIIINPAPAFR